MDSRIPHVFAGSTFFLLTALCTQATAAPPTQDDINVYASACKVGDAIRQEIAGGAGIELSLFARRVIGGEGKLSTEAIKDQFPGIKDEKNRLLVFQGYQDCLYRYVERFHSGAQTNEGKTAPSTSVIAPGMPPERRREILFLANQLEDFKGKMGKIVAGLPENYYDKKRATETKPKQDPHIQNLDNYNSYKAFQSPSGILDLSNVTNNDVALLCNTFSSELHSYSEFRLQYGKAFSLPRFVMSDEAFRICQAAARGR